MRLFDAAKSGDSAVVKRMLAQDSRLANASGYVRTSLWGSDALALHVAVMHGRVDIVDLLLAHGADINARDEKYRFKRPDPRHRPGGFHAEIRRPWAWSIFCWSGARRKTSGACAWLGDMTGVKKRLDEKPALVNEIGPGPSTLLSFCRDVETIQFYLDYGADPLREYERSGKYGRTTPLRDIAYRRNYEATRHLPAASGLGGRYLLGEHHGGSGSRGRIAG